MAESELVLAIDTCGPMGSVAIGRRDGSTISLMAQSDLAGKTHAAQLVPTVRGMLEAHGCEPRDLKAIVVVNGPGSFTGVRIGVSSAKGFAEALEIPVVAVSRLALLAWKAEAEASAIDAGRREFYFGGAGGEALLGPEEVRARTTGTLAVCEESAAGAFPEALLVQSPRASDALAFAGPRLAAGNFDDVALLDGNYVRRPDAELLIPQSTRQVRQTGLLKG